LLLESPSHTLGRSGSAAERVGGGREDSEVPRGTCTFTYAALCFVVTHTHTHTHTGPGSRYGHGSGPAAIGNRRGRREEETSTLEGCRMGGGL